MTRPGASGRLRHPARDGLAVIAALAGPLAAAVLLPFRSSWSNTNVALLLVVVVVAVAATGSRPAGALAAAWAAAWFDFFFTLPYYRFTIRGSADVTTAVLLLANGLAVSQLAAWARRLKVLAVTDEDYLAKMHGTAALAQPARSPEAAADRVGDLLASLLDLAEWRFEYGSLRSHPPRLEADGTVVAGDGSRDAEQAGLPAELELRVAGNGQYYGRFLLKPKAGSRPPVQARLVAMALAEQVELQRRPACQERALTSRPGGSAAPGASGITAWPALAAGAACAPARRSA